MIWQNLTTSNMGDLFFKQPWILFVYVKLLICKREGIINVRLVNSFKEKLKKFVLVVTSLNDNKKQQNQSSQQRDFFGY